MKNNTNLHQARRAKNDEFYTQLSDIEKECAHYRPHFNGATVLCNCNDALHSNFAKYFSLNFEHLGLKRLICTAYKVDGEHGKVCIYEGDKNGNRVPDIDEWECHMLEGDGGFASEECIALLKEADIVVTNPPFSLFREYVSLLMQYEKKFLIIGNGNAVTYKEIFPLIKENKMWLGAGKGMGGKAVEFMVNENIYDASKGSVNRIENGICYVGVMMVTWFTNLDHYKRHQEIDLYKHYNEEEYPKYDNYDAIEVGKVSEIPMDYDGVIGVPISFLDKYCPTQFEIIGFFNNYKPETANIELGQIYGTPVKIATTKSLFRGPVVNGKATYFRILIKKNNRINKNEECMKK